MIDATSLRIGNVILDRGYQPFLIETEMELSAIYDIPEDFHPLPITEYRLREMGFKVTKGPDQLDMYFMELLYFPDLSVTVNPVWTKERFDFGLPEQKTVPIKYVHELQNLIFDHTGQEVPVGLDPMP